MQTRWLNRRNESTGVDERFYPITHKDAIVGMENVDNTSDLDKPVSTIQGEAIADAKKAGTDAQVSVVEHINDKNNPHGVECETIGAVPTTRKVNDKVLNEDIVLTAEDIDAIPIVNACSADYDMDAIFTAGAHCAFYLTDEYTLNTPKALGVSTYNKALIFSYSSTTQYGKQMAFTSGGSYVLFRKLSNGVISDWSSEFLPLSGGTLTGDLYLNKAIPSLFFKTPNTTASADVYKNASSTADYGLYMLDASTDGKRMAFRACANEQKAQLVIRSSSTASDVHHDIYGTHNITKGTTDVTTAFTNGLPTNSIYLQYK